MRAAGPPPPPPPAASLRSKQKRVIAVSCHKALGWSACSRRAARGELPLFLPPEASPICLISLSLLCYQDTAAAGAREDTSERTHPRTHARTHAHRTGPALCILSRQLASPLAASCICKRCATCSSRQPCPGPRPVIQSEPS